MVKSQQTKKIIKEQPKKPATVENQKLKDKPLPAAKPGQPVRAVHYVEVGDMEHKQVALLVSEIGRQFNDNSSAIHFFVPVRHGKINSDILFEEEILDFVNAACEVKDGKIALKNPVNVQVVRNKIA